MTSPTGSGPRTMIAGDSWVRGLGRGVEGSIADFFPKAVDASAVLDLSKISRTVPDTAAMTDDIERFRPELALLAIGGADSLVFPAAWFQRLIDRFAPPKWAGVTGLMPPAYLPSDRRKRVRKRIETWVKTAIKQVLVNAFGARRRVPLDEVEQAARVLLRSLDRLGCVVLVMGASDVDDLTFPKSRKNIWVTNAMLRRLCEEYPRATYLDSRTRVEKWDDYLEDHVHLTAGGSAKVTRAAIDALEAQGESWTHRADHEQLAG